MFDRKVDILTWFGEHYADAYTPQTATYSIIADILTTIEQSPNATYTDVINMRFELQTLLKKYLEEWNKK